MILPSPRDLGLPEKFREWRNGQDAAVVRALDSPKRFIVQNAPTGFGKTVCYYAQAVLSGGRAAFLTVRKGLQSQLVADFASAGLVDMRGQANYPCKALLPGGAFRGQGVAPGEGCNAGPCRAGAKCSLRTAGCDYFDALLRAKTADRVVTNYSYWIAQHRHSDGLGARQLLVLDEAHEAPDELSEALEVGLTLYELDTLLGVRPLGDGADAASWSGWARRAQELAQTRLAALEEDGGEEWREIHALREIAKRLRAVAEMEGEWMVERGPTAVRFAPVWPKAYAERYLFLKIPKVVLVSATIRPKTLELLGIGSDEFEFHEYPSTFPVARRPVLFVPSVRCNHRWTETEQKTWVARMDQIIDQRLDRKGIIHTVSYERRNTVLAYTRHRNIMVTNDGTNTAAVVGQFRRMPAPAVLVSPSISSGWDLPLDECEYAIIGKIPFVDTRGGILAARVKADEHYSAYIAMLAIVQAAGRGMRSEDDQCEIFVLDDNWKWFWTRYRRFAPGWFREAVPERGLHTIPKPLPKLRLQRSLYA